MKLDRNKIVFAQGAIADTVSISKEEIKVLVVSEQAKAVVRILQPGQFFGEGCLNGHPLRIQRSHSARTVPAMPPSQKMRCWLYSQQAKFSELFMAYLLSRNSRIEEDLIDQLFNSSEKRLARLLLLLANFGKRYMQPIAPHVSQETLAEMIGTTRSRVSFFMNKFLLGLISYNGKIEVHSSLLNAVLYDKPEIERNE